MDHELAESMAKDLMRQHGLLDQGWAFEWSRSKRVFGRCVYRRKVLELSRWLTGSNPQYEVRDTVLHEIAHCLCPGHGHNNVWKKKCIEIGARPKARYGEEVTPTKRKYSLFCDCCKTVIKATDRLLSKADLSNKYHAKCGVQGIGKLKVLRNL
jgi:predicted SprT family Zn-dependent metalloprotease